MSTSETGADSPGRNSDSGVLRQRYYALFLLAAVYALSVLDRQIVAILLQPIKEDLHLSDTQLGFLSGIAFGIFYATLGLPIARLADVWNRRNVIVVSLSIFSVMTAICGLAGNFFQLFLGRVGVGIGEAGTTPPSTSIIADLFPERMRARAMALFTVGGNAGIFLGLVVAGVVAEVAGWRSAFLVAGLPGLALALLIALTVKEPSRGMSEGRSVRGETGAPSLMESLRFVWSQRAFRHLALGAALLLLFGNGSFAFFPSFLHRSFGMSLSEIGLTLGLLIGGFSAVGVLLAGVIADWLGARDVRWKIWIVAIVASAMFPFYVAIYLAQSKFEVLLALVLPATLSVFYQAPVLALVQGLAPLKMRAVAIATLLFVGNIIGFGVGPQLVGILSDFLNPRFGDDSLRIALLSCTPILLWAGLHFYLASRYLVADLRRAEAAA